MGKEPKFEDVQNIEDLVARGHDGAPAMDPSELEAALEETHRELDELVEGRTAAELLALNVSVQREIDVRKRLIEELTTLYERTEQLKGSETERERVQQAWEASEDRYRHLVENSLGLICAHDMDGVVLWANSAAARALGVRSEDAAGKRLDEFLAPAVRGLLPAYLRRIRERGRDEGIMRIVAADGREATWLYRNTVLEQAGQPPYVVGHAQDITEFKRTEEALRESEEKYRLLVEHASDAIFQVDLDGHVEFANRKAKVLFGYDAEELVGRHFIEFVCPKWRHRALRRAVEMRRRMEEDHSETRVELCFVKKDGSRRFGDLNLSFIHRDDVVVGALAIVRDTRGRSRQRT